MEYKVGDVLLDNFEVVDVKGGGMGVVYVCYDRKYHQTVALKSFQDKIFTNDRVVKMFYREAEVWMKLGRNKNIVTAHFVFYFGNKPHVLIEYIDGGTLKDRVVRGRLRVSQVLYLAIQFCDGMIHANSVDLGDGKKGIVHRDIKPENIMLTREGLLKITDFGLVKALDEVVEGFAGTAGYSSPEQFLVYTHPDERIVIDSRSDIYSFGIVLYEMLTGERPFKGPGLEEYAYQHMYQRPEPPRQINPSIPVELEPIVLKLLEKKREDRFRNFNELRKELMGIYKSRFGKVPEIKKKIDALTARKWCNRGYSLHHLGRYKDAMDCFNRALGFFKLDPFAWSGKGLVYCVLEEFEDALECFNRALRIDPKHVAALYYKGLLLIRLHRHDEAIECFNGVLKIEPRAAEAWAGKGRAMNLLGMHVEALRCYDNAIEVDPSCVEAWYDKGYLSYLLAKLREAIVCFDNATRIQPGHAKAWFYKGVAWARLGGYDEAIECLDKALQVDPTLAEAWINRGVTLGLLGRLTEAIVCFDRAIDINAMSAEAWYNKGFALDTLGMYDEAIGCLDRALEIDPGHEGARKLREKCKNLRERSSS